MFGERPEPVRNDIRLPHHMEVSYGPYDHFSLNGHACVEAWSEEKAPIIKANGYVLGQVHDVQDGTHDGQIASVKLRNELSGHRDSSTTWHLPELAKPVKEGDIVYLLQGLSKPTIIRLCADDLEIISFAVSVVKQMQIVIDGDLSSDWSQLIGPTSTIRELRLVGDWDIGSNRKD